MARSFVSSFLLPLVRGGRLHVGRPLGPRAVERLRRLASVAEDEAAPALAAARRAVAARFLRDAAPPPLDEATLRLGATVHDLLVLVHPALDGPTVARRQARVAAAAQALASLGAPASAVEAVNRHSLLARLAEIARTDSTVNFWLGRETFVGRVPPPRVTALPTLRRVRVDVVRRSWLRDIGVPTIAHDAVLALGVASPLGEALDPLRLEPPLCWSRILPVLRAPALGRIVAGRMLEVGLERAGDGLAAALLRFASFQDPPGGWPATPEAVAFALQFLAHLVWLDVLFGAEPAAAGAKPRTEAGPRPGGELASMLAAAARRAPALVWPGDVSADGALGRAFATRLEAFAGRARGEAAPAAAAAHGVAALAATAATSGHAAPIHIHI
ncbi:MAG TPA: hypothetical protein VG319_15260 [Polyangia bacterium]|jgi:hypothetical protein|nr:hypothetical protein [Polyangia bacterium]